MKIISRNILFFLGLAGLFFTSIFGQSGRVVAITIDDLPVVSRHFKDIESWQTVTSKIIKHLKAEQVPGIGFVNENKLYRDDILDEQRLNLLQQWLDNGLELGNHTFSHRSLHNISVEEYSADVLKGETHLKPMIEKNGGKLEFFRHPYLQTGRTLEIKAQLDSFLTAHNYRIAPVSMDNSEWTYAFAYDQAESQNDTEMMQRIGDAYLEYMTAVFAYFEQQSVALLGYELKQILLIHANRLNADYLGKLLKILKERGYKFIALNEALSDPAYQKKDTFTGNSGITWLHRWALGEGKKGDFFKGEPEVTDFVQAYFDQHIR